MEEVEAALTDAFGEAGVADPELSAALAMAAYRTVFVASVRRLLAGDPVAEVAREHRGRLESAFDALERTAVDG